GGSRHAPPGLQRLAARLEVGDEGEPDEARSPLAEVAPRDGHDAALEEPPRVLLVGPRGLRDPDPEEEGRVAAHELEPRLAEEARHELALGVEDLAARLGVGVVGPGRGARSLRPDGRGDAHVRAELREGGDRLPVARDEAGAVARHARALGAGVEGEDVLVARARPSLAELEEGARPRRRPDVDVALVRAD